MSVVTALPLRVEPLPLGGNALAQAMRAGPLPGGLGDGALAGRAALIAQCEAVRAAWTPAQRAAVRGWIDAATGGAAMAGPARTRLLAALEGGVLITTGQQPGLFGGPLYTWHKALSALALADALQDATGVPVAPLFWAATDDTDFAEGAATYLPTAQGSVRVELPTPDGAGDGVPTALLPLPPMGPTLDVLQVACGSSADGSVFEQVATAYAPSATVGSAYLALLRALLEPRGMAVLDAAHPAVRRAAAPVTRAALRAAPTIEQALTERGAALAAAGFSAQVDQVGGLSLVFEWRDGRKRRVPIAEAAAAADRADEEALSGNVLLRPVIERAIVPTMAYVAGPGELAYFAQVDVVADALAVPRPRPVARWSARVVETRVRAALDTFALPMAAFAQPERVLAEVARAELPPPLRSAMTALRQQVQEGLAAVMTAASAIDLPAAVGEGAAAQLSHRLDRFERRLVARAARQDETRRARVALVAGALYPGGSPQERALNAVPLLARHGDVLWAQWHEGAAQWAAELLGPDA